VVGVGYDKKLAVDKDGLTATNFTGTHETSLSKGQLL
jgi:hypothetical protein